MSDRPECKCPLPGQNAEECLIEKLSPEQYSSWLNSPPSRCSCPCHPENRAYSITGRNRRDPPLQNIPIRRTETGRKIRRSIQENFPIQEPVFDFKRVETIFTVDHINKKYGECSDSRCFLCKFIDEHVEKCKEHDCEICEAYKGKMRDDGDE